MVDVLSRVEIRAAEVADAAAVAAVHVPATPAHDVGAAGWAARLADDEARTYVAERDGEVVGFVSVCDAQDEDLAGWGEVLALYVADGERRCGVATSLLVHVQEVRPDDAGLALWVFADNTAARRFYAARGFRPDWGTLAPDPDSGLIELRYRTAPAA